MALETWLIKVKKTISQSLDSVRGAPPSAKKLSAKKARAGVLAFEIASLMSKLLHLWKSLSETNVDRLRSELICLEGVRKIVSNDDVFLLGLACAELAENLRLVAKSVSHLSKECSDPSLRCFNHSWEEFANTGRDPHNWLLSTKEMELKNKKFNSCISLTATLRREMDELLELENGLKKLLQAKNYDSAVKEQKIIELQQKILCQRQEIKYMKEKSLWCRSFDTVTSLLARSVFTTLARIKLVFGIGTMFPPSLPRSLSASAVVYPSENPNTCAFVSGPLMKNPLHPQSRIGFFESNSEVLSPSSSTLGAAALALHYANLINVIEKMIKSPQLVGIDARDELYSMLTDNIHFALRARLKGVGFSANDSILATEWREALHKILGWLSPMAHNMIKWLSERSFEHQNPVQKSNVVLLQTLYFADQEKVEAAITELLIGLNYLWRFEREMNAKALFHCSIPVDS